MAAPGVAVSSLFFLFLCLAGEAGLQAGLQGMGRCKALNGAGLAATGAEISMALALVQLPLHVHLLTAPAAPVASVAVCSLVPPIPSSDHHCKLQPQRYHAIQLSACFTMVAGSTDAALSSTLQRRRLSSIGARCVQHLSSSLGLLTQS